MAIGIIAEYNPFHNGHIYHLSQIKKDGPIILVLSGNYTQRGILSCIEKFDKAKIALEYGVDLVVELPFQFATQSSDFFSYGSLRILNYLKCERIVFGSESNNINELEELVDIQLHNKDYENIVKEELDKGLNYPTAMSNALKIISGKTVTLSNDLLGLSYIKEIKKSKYNIKAETIKRTNNYNDILLNDEISSATSIRLALKNNDDFTKSVPKETLDKIVNIDEDKILELLKYKVLAEEDLSEYLTVDEGIENRLKKQIINSSSLDELIKNVKSKRYTYNKINRMLTHILCSFKKNDKEDIKYIRVLGFTNEGQRYLNSIKKELEIPLITNINKNNIQLLKNELKVDNIYNLITNRKENLYKKKPIIKKE